MAKMKGFFLHYDKTIVLFKMLKKRNHICEINYSCQTYGLIDIKIMYRTRLIMK